MIEFVVYHTNAPGRHARRYLCEQPCQQQARLDSMEQIFLKGSGSTNYMVYG